MGLTIPLGGGSRPAEGTAAGSGGLKVPLNIFGSQQVGLSPAREDQILRAVAGAVAMRDPAAAIKEAADARNDPASVNFDGAVLQPALNAVAAVQAGRSPAPTGDDEQRAVAQSLGTSGALIKAADAALTDQTRANARAWVASVDPEVLDAGGRAAAKRPLLVRAEIASRQVGAVVGVEDRLAKVEAAIAKLQPPPVPPVP